MIGRLADEMLPALIARLHSSSLGELEVRQDGWRVRLRRPAVNGDARGSAAKSPDDLAGADPAHSGRPREHHAEGRPRPTPVADVDSGLVTSPAVGYFLVRDGVGVGNPMAQGDLIGHVDVLGVRHEVVAGIDGTLGGLDVASGQAVEYGQPVARIDPASRS